MGIPGPRHRLARTRQDGKAESLFYTRSVAGSALHTGLQAALEESVAKLPIPKLMSYQRPDGSHRAVRAPGPQAGRAAWRAASCP
jgi:glycyl-tRNA synthetase beta chain